MWIQEKRCPNGKVLLGGLKRKTFYKTYIKNLDLIILELDLMENLSLAVINLRTNKEMALASSQVFINKSPDFQRSYEAWDDKLRTRFIETMLLNRATNPIWTILNDDDDSEEILDGMHRITTALAFFNNDFSINKNYLLSIDSELYHKKKFGDLSSDDRSKIRNYNFTFNKLDSSYKNDTNKLRDMYEILNRSSKTLTDYEFNKVMLMPFYDIVSTHKESFMELNFFQKKNKRGNIDVEIIEMLVLTHDLPNCWSSITKLADMWIKKNIGDTTESVSEFVRNRKTDIDDKLVLMRKLIKLFKESELFSSKKGIQNKYYLIYKFIISRCCFFMKSYSSFNRIADNLKHSFSEILTENYVKGNRNAVFQKNVLNDIDEIIKNTIRNDEHINNRLFTKKQISEKLASQNNICPLCDLVIKSTDEHHGDHIQSWTSGGPTIIGNLQVLHKRCHQHKNA